MRSLAKLNDFRVEHPLAGWGDDRNGAFFIKLLASKLIFKVIVSDGGGWEHVSVSTDERTPRWDEMNRIKDLFFEDNETVMQLHPPKSDYVNNHPHCLHLWRPIDKEIPLPHVMMV